MNQDLITSIEDMGLSQKEAKVYLASLIIGPSAVQKIADKSEIKRVTTYVILESLIALGLMSQSTRAKKTVYIAEPPLSLRRLLDKKEEALRDQKTHLDLLLPQLSTIRNLQVDSPSVKFYDSAEGIRAMVASFLSSHKDTGVTMTYGMSNLDQLYAFFPEFERQSGNPDRQTANIASRFIYTTKMGAIYHESDKARNRISRFVPAEQYPLNGDLSIVGDIVVLLSLSGSRPIGVTIESAELAKTMQAVFELAWKAAESFN